MIYQAILKIKYTKEEYYIIDTDNDRNISEYLLQKYSGGKI